MYTIRKRKKNKTLFYINNVRENIENYDQKRNDLYIQ